MTRSAKNATTKSTGKSASKAALKKAVTTTPPAPVKPKRSLRRPPVVMPKTKPQVRTLAGHEAKDDEQWVLFIDELSKCANVSNACTVAGISRTTAYDRRRDDPEFRVLWEEAEERGWFALEQMAKQRAFDGVKKPVFYKGRRVSEIIEYSDALTVFLMKGRMRKVFGDKQEVTVTGSAGSPYAKLSEEEIDSLIAQRLSGDEV
jgi:hypothetical protein